MYIRPRPILPIEAARGTKSTRVEVDSAESRITVTHEDRLRSKLDRRSFVFDHVFPCDVNQADVFDALDGSRLLNRLLSGFNASVLVYGQTATGKTWTMDGHVDSDSSGDSAGLVPRFILNLFSASASTQSTITFSYFQIYNERVFDLLNNGSSSAASDQLRLRFRGGEFKIENLFSFECASADEMMAHYIRGRTNRAMGSHQLNDSSSRSHTIARISVREKSGLWKSSLSLVDLAGCERVNDTESTGSTFKESLSINQSLLVLRRVITALASRDKSVVIPYRESKLTSILKDSFGGNSITIMIACLSPLDAHADDNLSTLYYSQQARRVMNSPVENVDPQVKQIADLNNQLSVCYRYIEDNVGVVPDWLRSPRRNGAGPPPSKKGPARRKEVPERRILELIEIQTALTTEVNRIKRTTGSI